MSFPNSTLLSDEVSDFACVCSVRTRQFRPLAFDGPDGTDLVLIVSLAGSVPPQVRLNLV